MQIIIGSRAQPSLAYFLIAVFSGIAVAYALVRPSVSEVLPGIAITVALAPPLAAVGVALSFLRWEMVVGSLGLFFLNLIGIIFAALVVFSVLKFFEVRELIEKKIRAEEREMQEEKKEKQKEDIVELEKTVKEAAEVLKEKKNGEK